MSFYLSLPRLLVQCNFSSFIIFILLGTFICTNKSFSKKVNTRFIVICLSTLLLTVTDNIRFVTFHENAPSTWRYLSAAFGYTIRPLFLFLIVTLTGQSSKKNINWLLTIPLFINGIISFLNCLEPFHGLMYSFTEQNIFIRGTLGYLPYYTSAFYIILIFYEIFKKKSSNPLESAVIFVLILLGCFATVMESIFKYDLILSQVMIIGTVFYYLFLNVQIYKHDSLTQLKNRRFFYLELDKLKKNSFILISMDLNNLKVFNDTLGHAAGDEALIFCTESMRKHFKKNCKLYRIGGDEFMCICKNLSRQNVESLVNSFQNDMNNSIYKVACGIAEYNPGDDIDKIISISDASMYKNKKLLKKQD